MRVHFYKVEKSVKLIDISRGQGGDYLPAGGQERREHDCLGAQVSPVCDSLEEVYIVCVFMCIILQSRV